MGAEQRQQERDFFLRTDLDHDCLLFAWLVGAGEKGVQDNRVSGLFQACFIGAVTLQMAAWRQSAYPPVCHHVRQGPRADHLT
ncbi:bsr6109 [Bradyrhizobium diazoefficiens USDA 110]|uniref:Bsr6109 protein n=1 Tax=Bradyrhizobium diazoefficiens (strain JCM 10833 / BCRC 13528 / IAM 13628 / NBRC 14792 / USDA 110) TaxID=224911 RepID=Q89H85_BRADU|nr:hypothetical protein Bdiaspc4_32205 [Bradyrhizobium diazoefficiens]BAC51374.1 bsr6109 [Bradyrhizobium diazoefficiens USDA 110]